MCPTAILHGTNQVNVRCPIAAAKVSTHADTRQQRKSRSKQTCRTYFKCVCLTRCTLETVERTHPEPKCKYRLLAAKFRYRYTIIFHLFPFLFLEFANAPQSKRLFTSSARPSVAARMRGVQPLASMMSTSPPALTRARATSACPCLTAQ